MHNASMINERDIVNRILWIELAKTIATFFVVLLHTAAPALYRLGDIKFEFWRYANIYDSSVRLAVPVFFMISGALLLGKDTKGSVPIFLKKRILKVLVPLVGWSAIYIFFSKYILHKDISILASLMQMFFSTQYYHLWFLYVILGIYFFIPIFQTFINNSTIKLQLYFLTLWILMVSIVPLMNKLFPLKIPNHMPMMSGYIGYLLIGYIIARMQITKKYFYLAICIFTVSTMSTIVLTEYFSLQSNKFDGFFYGYFSVTTLPQAVSFLMAIKFFGERVEVNIKKRLIPIIYKLSLTSLGIYLVHPIVLWIISSKLNIHVLNGGNPIYLVPATAGLVFLISFIVTRILQKIPIVQMIVPK